MTSLEEHDLERVAPSSITRDEKIQALCSAISGQLRAVAADVPLVLILARLDELDDDLLDHLAWQYHIDFYDSASSLSVKRESISGSIAWHRHKGTPRAVQEVVTKRFQSAVVEENWLYGGEPYHFRVRLITEPLTGETMLRELVYAIYEAKNVRSWLDGVEFSRESAAAVYTGGALSLVKRVEIWPAVPVLRDIEAAPSYAAAGVSVHRKVGING